MVRIGGEKKLLLQTIEMYGGSDVTKKATISELWSIVEERFHFVEMIEKDGFFRITANELGKIKEARLMAKIDHANDLPQIFKDNHLAILPETRGSYLIAPMELYQSFDDSLTNPKNSDIQHISWDMDLQSLDISHITSETIAINTADVGGILTSFLHENPLIATVSGRMKSDVFSFHVNRVGGGIQPVNVQNSQIEIDAGFESPDSLILLEAKNYVYDDFLVRQLYYPMRTWQQKIQKPVRTVFFMYSNGVYHLIEYGFRDLQDYNSLYILQHSHYSLDDTNIRVMDIYEVAAQVKQRKEPRGIPFPQADKMWRIINLAEMLVETPMTKVEIAEQYSFTGRQADYYSNAARYLGLLEDGKEGLQASKLMERLMKKPYKLRQLEYVKLILRTNVFYDVFQKTHVTNTGVVVLPPRDEIIAIMRSHLSLGSEAMYARRAQSIRGWIEWIFHLCRDVGEIQK